MGADKSSKDARWASWRIFLVIMALTTALVTSYYLTLRSNAASTGYLYYYYFDLLSSQSGVVLLAFFAGLASFFSPCAFALLPGYMSYYISLHENKVGKGRNRLFKSIHLGSLSALGILMLYTISGAMVAVFGASVEPYVVLMQPIVGATIAGLGLVLLTDYSFDIGFLNRFIHRIERGAHEESKHSRLSRKLFLYGVGYGAAAAACTAPIFISLMIYSLVYEGLFMTVTAFLTYSITMGTMMVITTMLVGLAKEKLLDKMRTSALLIKRASGFVLIIAGAYLVISLLFRQLITEASTLLPVPYSLISSTNLFQMGENIVKRTVEKQLAKHQIKIGGMSCSFCAETIRKACSRLEGVERVNVSLSHEEALFQYDPSKIEPWQIEETLRNLGYKVYDPNKIRTFEEQEAELQQERNRLFVSSGLTVIAALFMLSMWLGLRPFWFVYVMVGTALGNVFVVGYPILRMAYHSLRRRILNQHVLLEFGAFGGLAGGFIGFFLPSFPVADFFAVAVFITAYHILSGYASLRVRTKSSQAVRKLLDLQPPTARIIRDGEEMVVNTGEVRKGEFVLIKPGESIPVDGVVIDSSSTVDESLVTGESIPVEKVVGNEVIGGSINLTGMLKVKVTHVGEESFLHKIARYVEEARALKPGILQLVDIVLKYYVPIVLLFAAIGFLAWSLGAWIFFGDPDIPRAIFAALSVLVMGYPCALGMATPLAMIRGGGIAAEKGVLMRSSEAFQALKDVKKIVFDKTGTITKGKPQVVEVSPFNNHKESEVLEVAASVERLSEHPLAEAIVKKAQEYGLREREVTIFRNFPGQGVKASLNNKAVIVGNPQILSSEGVKLSLVQDKVRGMEEEGETVVAVAYDGVVVGLIGIADTVKEDALETVERLKAEGLDPIILTGDNERTARAVAAKVGIENVIAQVLPDQKTDRIRKLQEQGYRVAMVGDGINDAPALMQADVGIAIGAGTDIAIESADVIIIGDRLSAVVDAYHIGKNSYRKTKHNLTLAFAFNGIGVPAATTGLVHPVWAMLAMIASVSTVLLISFGGRLVPKPKRREKMRVNKVVLEVPSMHCEGCLSAIAEAVSQIEGLESVKGDVKKRLVTIGYRGSKEVEESIRRKIIEKGYVVA